jgi:deoxycytidylate deaminase
MLKEIKDAEIFIGIVGAVGTDLALVTRVIQEELRIVEYGSAEIKLSRLLTEIDKYKGLKKIEGGEKARIKAFMDAGDDIRDVVKLQAAMAYLGVAGVREVRTQISGNEQEPAGKFGYILNSLKRPEEIKDLKRIYGDLFVVFSIFSPREERIKKLAENICKSNADSNPHKYEEDAKELVDRDERDESGHKTHGQDVQEAFPLGDFFIRMGSEDEVRKQVKRFVEIWFGHPFKTPTIDEYGMYFANAVAKRSADLSRQVGAAILTREGDVLTVGCNDVPKYGGGIPWEGEEGDYRDFQIGRDPNVNTRDELLKEMFQKLEEAGWLSTELNKTALELTALAVQSKTSPLNGTRVASLLEFGRVVHAEMNALMSACKRGVPVKGATLYCTTFPCHMCARHIIAAGIERVVFIEPYPKSLAEDLYSHMASIDTMEKGKVSFESFMGMAPSKYTGMFERSKRKHSDGYAYSWGEVERYPKVNLFREGYIDFEAAIVRRFSEKIQECFGLKGQD